MVMKDQGPTALFQTLRFVVAMMYATVFIAIAHAAFSDCVLNVPNQPFTAVGLSTPWMVSYNEKVACFSLSYTCIGYGMFSNES